MFVENCLIVLHPNVGTRWNLCVCQERQNNEDIEESPLTDDQALSPGALLELQHTRDV